MSFASELQKCKIAKILSYYDFSFSCNSMKSIQKSSSYYRKSCLGVELGMCCVEISCAGSVIFRHCIEFLIVFLTAVNQHTKELMCLISLFES